MTIGKPHPPHHGLPLPPKMHPVMFLNEQHQHNSSEVEQSYNFEDSESNGRMSARQQKGLASNGRDNSLSTRDKTGACSARTASGDFIRSNFSQKHRRASTGQVWKLPEAPSTTPEWMKKLRKVSKSLDETAYQVEEEEDPAVTEMKDKLMRQKQLVQEEVRYVEAKLQKKPIDKSLILELPNLKSTSSSPLEHDQSAASKPEFLEKYQKMQRQDSIPSSSQGSNAVTPGSDSTGERPGKIPTTAETEALKPVASRIKSVPLPERISHENGSTEVETEASDDDDSMAGKPEWMKKFRKMKFRKEESVIETTGKQVETNMEQCERVKAGTDSQTISQLGNPVQMLLERQEQPRVTPSESVPKVGLVTKYAANSKAHHIQEKKKPIPVHVREEISAPSSAHTEHVAALPSGEADPCAQCPFCKARQNEQDSEEGDEVVPAVAVPIPFKEKVLPTITIKRSWLTKTESPLQIKTYSSPKQPQRPKLEPPGKASDEIVGSISPNAPEHSLLDRYSEQFPETIRPMDSVGSGDSRNISVDLSDHKHQESPLLNAPETNEMGDLDIKMHTKVTEAVAEQVLPTAQSEDWFASSTGKSPTDDLFEKDTTSESATPRDFFSIAAKMEASFSPVDDKALESDLNSKCSSFETCDTASKVEFEFSDDANETETAQNAGRKSRRSRSQSRSRSRSHSRSKSRSSSPSRIDRESDSQRRKKKNREEGLANPETHASRRSREVVQSKDKAPAMSEDEIDGNVSSPVKGIDSTSPSKQRKKKSDLSSPRKSNSDILPRKNKKKTGLEEEVMQFLGNSISNLSKNPMNSPAKRKNSMASKGSARSDKRDSQRSRSFNDSSRRDIEVPAMMKSRSEDFSNTDVNMFTTSPSTRKKGAKSSPGFDDFEFEEETFNGGKSARSHRNRHEEPSCSESVSESCNPEDVFEIIPRVAPNDDEEDGFDGLHFSKSQSNGGDFDGLHMSTSNGDGFHFAASTPKRRSTGVAPIDFDDFSTDMFSTMNEERRPQVTPGGGRYMIRDGKLVRTDDNKTVRRRSIDVDWSPAADSKNPYKMSSVGKLNDSNKQLDNYSTPASSPYDKKKKNSSSKNENVDGFGDFPRSPRKKSSKDKSTKRSSKSASRLTKKNATTSASDDIEDLDPWQ